MHARRSLVAAALALPGAAFAQTPPPDTSWGVQLRLQPELVHVSGSAARARGQTGWYLTDAWAGGSRNAQNFGGLFIDGGQRLGDDLRLIGRYALNLSMDGLQDNRRLRHREIFVGLDGSWGQVRVGRLDTPYWLSTLAWDPLNGTFLQARGNLGRSPGPLGHGGYVNDAIDYTRKFGAATWRLFYARNDAPGAAPSVPDSDPTVSTSLNLPVGPWEFAIAHADAGNRGAGPRRATKFAARWTGEAFGFHGHYEARGRGLENADYLLLGGTWRSGPTTIALNGGRFADDSAAGNDGRYLALGASHRFSPQLAIHGGVRRSERDRGGHETLIGLGLRIVLEAKGGG